MIYCVLVVLASVVAGAQPFWIGVLEAASSGFWSLVGCRSETDDIETDMLRTVRFGTVWEVEARIRNAGNELVDRCGYSALRIAIDRGESELVELLLQNGVDVKQDTERLIGWTPISYAAEEGVVEIVELLIRFGADINQRDRLGLTALHFAAKLESTDIINLLIGNNAELNHQSIISGCTPLHFATMSGRVGNVNALINAGAELGPRSHGGETALDMARALRVPSIAAQMIQILEEAEDAGKGDHVLK